MAFFSFLCRFRNSLLLSVEVQLSRFSSAIVDLERTYAMFLLFKMSLGDVREQVAILCYFELVVWSFQGEKGESK